MKLEPADKLFYKLKNNKVPLVVQWELTTRCNLDCMHCCIKNEKQDSELSFGEIKDILRQLKAENCMIQRFSGGEVFLRKDIFKIIELARKMQFGVMVLSNGTLLDRSDIKNLKKIGILDLQVSLYGATASMHDSITNVKGSFDKTMNTIGLCRKYKVPFHVAVMSFNKNFHELSQIKRIARKEKCKTIFDFVILPAVSSSKDPLSLRATDEQIKLAVRSGLLVWSRRNRLRSKKITRPEQFSGNDVRIEIGASGKVFPSVIMRKEAGDLRRESFSQIWRHSRTFRYLRSLDEKSFECFSCEYYNKCCKNRDLAYLEHGDVTVKPQEICRINRIFHENVGKR